MIKKSFVAMINERSSHSVPTPHGGGIAIALSWFLGLCYLHVQGQIDSTLFYSLICGLVLSVVSFLDDIYELSPKIRLLTQLFVSSCGLYFLGGLEILTLGFFEISNQIITTIFSLLLIIWFINLYNFLDGINGYAGSEAVFLGIAGFLLFNSNIFLLLIVCVLGFLCWNYNKAKIFMGDVGSTLLGYNVAIFTIYYANEEPSNFWIWIILFSLFWFDATVTLIRRKLNGEKLSIAHKKHLYQRLTQAGWSHFRVANYSIFVNFILFLIVYFISNLFYAFLIALMVLSICMKFIDEKKGFA